MGKPNFSLEESLVFIVKGTGYLDLPNPPKFTGFKEATCPWPTPDILYQGFLWKGWLVLLYCKPHRSTELYYLCFFYACSFKAEKYLFSYICVVSTSKGRKSHTLDLATNFYWEPTKLCAYEIIINNYESSYNWRET